MSESLFRVDSVDPNNKVAGKVVCETCGELEAVDNLLADKLSFFQVQFLLQAASDHNLETSHTVTTYTYGREE